MNEIIISSNDGRMSSLGIANLTGKEHKNVGSYIHIYTNKRRIILSLFIRLR